MGKSKPTVTTNSTNSQVQNSNTAGTTDLNTSNVSATNNQNTSSTAIPVWQQNQWDSLLGQMNNAGSQAVGANITPSAGAQSAADLSNGFLHNALPGINNTFGNTTQGILNQQVDPNALSSQMTSNDPYAKISADPNSSWNSNTASQYMSPYTQQVIDANDKIANRNLSQQLSGVDSNFASSGALGGDRNAVERANTSAQALQNMNAQDASLLNAGYSNGQSQFNADQARRLQTAAGTSGVNQQAIQDLLAGTSSNIYSNFAAGQNLANQVGTQNQALSGASSLGSQNLQNQMTAAGYPLSVSSQMANILGMLPNQSTVTQTGRQLTGNEGATNGTSNSTTNASSSGNGQQSQVQSGGNSWMQGLGSIIGTAAMFLNEGGIVDSTKAKKRKKGKKNG